MFVNEHFDRTLEENATHVCQLICVWESNIMMHEDNAPEYKICKQVGHAMKNLKMSITSPPSLAVKYLLFGAKIANCYSCPLLSA